MTLTVGTSSGNKAVTALHVGTSSGTKAVSEGWIGTASGNKQFYSSTPAYPPLTADASPNSQFWNGTFPAPQDADVLVTAGGGSGSYTYAWEIVSGSGSFDDATVASAHVNSGDGLTLTVRCLVSDATAGTSTYSDEITIS